MKTIAQNKLTKKLLFLFVLAGALVYLRTPTEARATTCAQLCAEEENACERFCFRSPNPEACLASCMTQYNACIAKCN
jgi:hypothetical protein